MGCRAPESRAVAHHLVASGELGVPLRGTVERSTRQDYSNATVVQNVWSPAGQLLATHRWLPDHEGKWRRPDELSHDDLSEEFPEDEALARRLGMRPTVGREIAAYLEIEPEDLELLRRNPDILREALSSSVSLAETDRTPTTSANPKNKTEPSTWTRRSAKHSTSPDESRSTSSSETVEPPTPSGGVREQRTRSARHRRRTQATGAVAHGPEKGVGTA